MKYAVKAEGISGRRSHPPRGGWIEIGLLGVSEGNDTSPTPHGVGGLK